MRLVNAWCALGLAVIAGCGRAELYAPEDGAVMVDVPIPTDDRLRIDVPVGPEIPIFPDVPRDVPRDVRDAPDVPDVPPGDCRTGLLCPSSAPICRMDTGECVQCLGRTDCPRGLDCVANRCVPSVDCRIAESCTRDRPICRPDTGECVQCTLTSHCPAGNRCVANACQPSCGDRDLCAMGETCCGSVCLNAATDPLNCGGCGVACRMGARCVDARCVVAPGCGAGGECVPGSTCCGEVCTNVESDTANCGRCGVSCGPFEVCSGGACVATGCGMGPPCAPGVTCCGAACADLQSDSANCGACGRSCGPGGTCNRGVCLACACPGGLSCCGMACFDLGADPLNCGACGNACAAGQRCLVGRCSAVMCAPGTADCDGDPRNNCEADLVSDVLNCGACRNACGPGGRCVMGRCTVVMGCAGGPSCAPGTTCCAEGCLSLEGDVNNCGACANACPSPPNTVRTCVAGRCGMGACNSGFGDCNRTPADGCEANLNTDARNCGGCGLACASGQMCVSGVCSMTAMGREGAFAPTVNPTFLTPGLHDFTTIAVPSGVVVYLAGGGGESGLLDLRATGDVRVDGTIDVSGGPGGQSTITSRSTRQGRAGAGGFTGDPRTATPGPACEWVGGVSGGNGRGLVGSTGTCRTGSNSACITDSMTQLIFASPVAQFGGGAGVFSGYRAYGAGGGGYSGGAAGALGPPYMGQLDCSGVTAGGGATDGRGGSASVAAYNGRNGSLGQTQCPGSRPGVMAGYVGGGGGGSIGSAASMDLPISTTFQPGSGGGGGSADYLNRPAFGGTSGGGGGGGALRIWSQTQITVNGRLLANGGDGGDAYIGTNLAAGCDPQPGAAGGGGSGGVVFLRAPAITTGPRAVVSAAGGAGGAGSLYATGGAGGAGGIGRIRLSVNPGACSLAGSFTPALVAGCATTPVGVQGRAYTAAYPD